MARRYVDDCFPTVRRTDAIAFGVAVNSAGRQQTLYLTLFEPADDPVAARAAVVYAHGGGFWEGTRESDHAGVFGHGFARKGYVVISIDYRIRPGHGPFPTTDPELPAAIRDAQHDFQAAIRWLRRHADTLRVDPRNIFACGTSAGAITALYAAYNQTDVGDSGNAGYGSQVNAVASKSGAMLTNDLITVGGPGACFFHGTKDSKVPLDLAVGTYSAVKAAGLPVQYRLYERQGHDVVPPADVVTDAAAFFAGLMT
jgi:acetyl esterase/lipase